MKGSTGRTNSNINSLDSARTQQALQSSLHAQPFVPDSGASSSSQIPGRESGRGLNPFTPAAPAGGVMFRHSRFESTHVSLVVKDSTFLHVMHSGNTTPVLKMLGGELHFTSLLLVQQSGLQLAGTQSSPWPTSMLRPLCQDKSCRIKRQTGQ